MHTRTFIRHLVFRTVSSSANNRKRLHSVTHTNKQRLLREEVDNKKIINKHKNHFITRWVVRVVLHVCTPRGYMRATSLNRTIYNNMHAKYELWSVYFVWLWLMSVWLACFYVRLFNANCASHSECLYLSIIDKANENDFILFRLSFFHTLLYESDARQHRNYAAPIRHKLVKLWRPIVNLLLGARWILKMHSVNRLLCVTSVSINSSVNKHRRMFGIIREWELPEMYGSAQC